MANPFGAGTYEQILAALRAARANGTIDEAGLDAIARRFVNEALRSNPDLGAHIPGSAHYRRATRDEPPGASYRAEPQEPRPREFDHSGDAFAYMFGGAGRYGTRTPPSPPPTPERRAAIDRIRSLQRMVDSSTYEGERANAKAAIQRLRDKHGITPGEA